MRILMVDDDVSCRTCLTKLLQAHLGSTIEISVAGDLGEAFRLLSGVGGEVDVILCDGHFPVGTAVVGWQVQQKPWLPLWAFARPKPFALLTGDPIAALEARGYGIPAFLKPFKIEAILEFLAAAFPTKVGWPS